LISGGKVKKPTMRDRGPILGRRSYRGNITSYFSSSVNRSRGVVGVRWRYTSSTHTLKGGVVTTDKRDGRIFYGLEVGGGSGVGVGASPSGDEFGVLGGVLGLDGLDASGETIKGVL